MVLDLLRDVTRREQDCRRRRVAERAGVLRYWSAPPWRWRGASGSRPWRATTSTPASAWRARAPSRPRPPPGRRTAASPSSGTAGRRCPPSSPAVAGPGPGGRRTAQAERSSSPSCGLGQSAALAACRCRGGERILGGRAGRLVQERAHGVDPRPVTPSEPPHSLAGHHDFDRDTLDAATVRAALLASSSASATPSATGGSGPRAHPAVNFADRSRLIRSRTLPRLAQPRTSASRVPGVRLARSERARVRGVTLRAETPSPGGDSPPPDQPGPGPEGRLRAEPAVDRANRRFGPGT